MKSNMKRIAMTAGAFAGLFSIHSFAESGAAAGGFGAYGTLIWMVLLLAVFYFMLIRPQKSGRRPSVSFATTCKTGIRSSPSAALPVV